MNIVSKFVFFFSTLIFSAAVLSAQTKPNFSGTWELNLGKSDMGGAPISKLVVQIEHKDR